MSPMKTGSKETSLQMRSRFLFWCEVDFCYVLDLNLHLIISSIILGELVINMPWKLLAKRNWKERYSDIRIYMYEYSYVFKFSRFLNQHRSFLHKPSHLILIHSISFPAIDFVSYYFRNTLSTVRRIFSVEFVIPTLCNWLKSTKASKRSFLY